VADGEIVAMGRTPYKADALVDEELSARALDRDDVLPVAAAEGEAVKRDRRAVGGGCGREVSRTGKGTPNLIVRAAI
jgi:hypothetical protein